jgi:hypothetical protein
MKRNKILLIFITSALSVLFQSCDHSAISKDSNTKKKFQTVVLKGEVLKKYMENPEFSFFIFQYDPQLLGGVVLEATAFNKNNGIIDSKIKLGKLSDSKPAELVNVFAGNIFLTRQRLVENEVQPGMDYTLEPRAYRDSSDRPQGYVSYFFNQRIQPFRRAFKSFTLDPSPPALR